MPFEAFDKKIEEAAAHHHPVYDEQAWNKMKLLLDKHLPEKKEKKRRFFWIWFLLFFLAGGSTMWLINNQYKAGNKQKEFAADKTSNKKIFPGEIDNSTNTSGKQSIKTEKQAANNRQGKDINTTAINTNDNIDIPQNSSENISKASSNNIILNKSDEIKTTVYTAGNTVTTKNNSTVNSKNKTSVITSSSARGKGTSLKKAGKIYYDSDNIIAARKKKAKNNAVSTLAENNELTNIVASDATLKAKDQNEVLADKDISLTDVKDDENKVRSISSNELSISNTENKKAGTSLNSADSATSAINEKATVTNTKVPRKKKSLSNSFALSISAGPDVSAVGLSQVGSTRIVYGAGLSYQFAQKWNIRTGIYTTSKVYHARPSDYDPPSYFWSYYPSLEKINANCRVYEIPVIISYIVSQQKKHSWFASAGLSSLIMKREIYDYISKTSTGYETRSYTINDQNKHWMAEARLSFGYQQHFGNSSFTIEPYINAPLKGVGYGKVKLSGAGILFSVSIKPFAKK